MVAPHGQPNGLGLSMVGSVVDPTGIFCYMGYGQHGASHGVHHAAYHGTIMAMEQSMRLHGCTAWNAQLYTLRCPQWVLENMVYLVAYSMVYTTQNAVVRRQNCWS